MAKEIKNLKEIEKEIKECKLWGVMFMIGMLISGVFFHKYEFGRIFALMSGFLFIAFLITMRYWMTKKYMLKMFDKLKKTK